MRGGMQIHAHQQRDDRRDNQDAAHCGRAGLDLVRGRAFDPNLLADSMSLQKMNQRAST